VQDVGRPVRQAARCGRGGGSGDEQGVDVTAVSQEDVLLALVRMSMDASVRASQDVGGVSPVQLRALTALRQMGEASLAQLSDEIGITVSTGSRLVDRLVGAEWVHRGASPHNRRQISLTLTETGKRLLRRYDRRRVTLLTECLERVPAERRDAVLAALGELARVSHA
jgi:DNA-binding MarR family transcriptional regulator